MCGIYSHRGYFEARDHSRRPVTDQFTVRSALVIGGVEHYVSDYGDHAPDVVHGLESGIEDLLGETLWHDRVLERTCEPLLASITGDCGQLDPHALRWRGDRDAEPSMTSRPACARKVSWLHLGALPCEERAAPPRTQAMVACLLFNGT